MAALSEKNNSALGELLRRAREQRGLTLEQIANETKISTRHLEALERDNQAAVPGEFYRRAEIRAYARAVGLDENLALAQLESPVRPSAQPQAGTERPGIRHFLLSRSRLVLAIGVVAAAALLDRVFDDRQAEPEQDRQTVGDAPDLTPLPPPSKGVIDASIEPAAARGAAAFDADLVTTSETADTGASADPVTQLVVTTQPAGARVTVNGIGWGTSPVTIRYLPPGDKRIRVSKDGYATQERVMRLDEGGPRTLDIRLNSAP